MTPGFAILLLVFGFFLAKAPHQLVGLVVALAVAGWLAAGLGHVIYQAAAALF